jgi:D-methionine transport system permease protein
MSEIAELLIPALWETIYMVFFSSVFSVLMGFPIGIALVVSDKGGILENSKVYRILDTLVNVCRSFPFIILMILIFPLSRIIVGTTIGTTASIVPLSIAAAPFVGRIIENALKDVDKGVIEAVEAMGASPGEIIFKAMIPEAMPSLVMGITLTIINLIGYSAMAGAIGGGGLGDLAIRYGFYRFQTKLMVISVIVIIVLVQGIQFIGNNIAKRLLENH